MQFKQTFLIITLLASSSVIHSHDIAMRHRLDKDGNEIKDLPERVAWDMALPFIQSDETITRDSIIGTTSEKREALFTDLEKDQHPRPGFLFYGIAGTGKTLTGQALANTLDAVFMHVNIGNVIDHNRHAGKEVVHELFVYARQWAKKGRKVIIFLDDIHECGKRGAQQDSNALSITRALYAEMKKPVENKKITVITATKKQPEEIDEVFLDDSLFQVINFDVPDKESRKKILSHYFKQTIYCKRRNPLNIDEEILDQTEGLSGGKLKEFVEHAVAAVAKRNDDWFNVNDLNYAEKECKSKLKAKPVEQQSKEVIIKQEDQGWGKTLFFGAVAVVGTVGAAVAKACIDKKK